MPAFAQTGVEEVQRRILLGVGAENIEGIGLHEAQIIEKTLSGVKPWDISQIYAQDQGIGVNLKTAMQMGWQPPDGASRHRGEDLHDAKRRRALGILP